MDIKEYITPDVEIIAIKYQAPILSASTEEEEEFGGGGEGGGQPGI